MPHQVYHDINAGYEFAQSAGWLADTEIQLGARNVFNKSPPFDASSFPYYSVFGDPRLASYYLTLKKGF